MALYRLQESYSVESCETLLESFEAFVLTEASRKGEKVLTRELDSQQQQFEEYSKKIESQEAELKKVMEEKPKSWLERKLESFKAAIERFEEKYKLTQDNKSKTIIKKILSVLARIVKWINEKLLNLTRYVGDKVFGRQDKIDAHNTKVNSITSDIKDTKNKRRNLDKAINKTKDRLANTTKGKSNNYNMSIDNFRKQDNSLDKEKFHNTFQKAMNNKGKLVFGN
jgi:hypothetical protein